MVVKQATKLDSNHLVVVYKQKEEIIERRIVTGPCVFIPGPEEWWVILGLRCRRHTGSVGPRMCCGSASASAGASAASAGASGVVVCM